MTVNRSELAALSVADLCGLISMIGQMSDENSKWIDGGCADIIWSELNSRMDRVFVFRVFTKTADGEIEYL